MNYVTTNAVSGNELKNEPATSGRTCHCGSWIAHWKTYTGKSALPTCVVEGCNAKAEVGAHVEFTRQDDEKGLSYIAPMCGDHNKDHDLVFQSKPGYRLARGNVRETCGG
ncbi:hypothetical protein QU487_06625 [Crenobacter sp. SG2305]|uniref:hypothetical protein n=1 Tax=Crenobacter oryzisoli TaxID=3056844 RepID=UPI0025AA83F8|nr:hypothetical protein [Crenobacter sp. SG2305]MDN0082428.1 hypothetical protein [Crenobacter sp. SG2305]